MTLKDQWESYRRAVLLPIHAGKAQTRETRRAFYAGAQAMSAILVTGISDSEEMAEQDVNVMESVDLELEQFAEDLKRGKA